MKLLSMVVFSLFFMGGYTTTLAGEWNEKPIMCANEVETFDAINTKKEELVFKAVQFTKVRTETGLAKKPATLPFSFYINLQTGTYTVIEYHAEYETYCVIAYGTNLQTFGSSPL